MSYQFRILSEDTTEPVTLSEAKSFMRIDADYTAEDQVIEGFISASRERMENYLNLALIDKQIELQWNGSAIVLPFSPTQDIVSLKDIDGNTIPADEYTVRGLTEKTIFLNSFGGDNIVWFYPQEGGLPGIWSGTVCNEKMYNVIYNTGEWVKFPVSLRMAILHDVDHIYKNQGMDEQKTISEQAITLSEPYSKNLIIQN